LAVCKLMAGHIEHLARGQIERGSEGLAQ
jgi:hypothetical protein